ncbi:AAA family ATPase [Kineococcus sp. SYSU DK006]|uniref:AAA family ATPase n=1 Tax=Kineococcus sp. SYSU DK006 TaxID=3383127 RepID=UPI003D7D6858
MPRPLLVVVCGLPGAGKSALADALGRALPAPVLSVDPVEAALWRAGIGREQPTGLAAYAVAQELAGRVLALGQAVVADAVNDAPQARAAWADLARTRGARCRFVEVRCPDEQLHRRRLETRVRDLDGFPEPAWEAVQRRRAAFADWTGERLVADSRRPLPELVSEVLADLAEPARPLHPADPADPADPVTSPPPRS